jgi:hypothetical protein
MVGGTYSAFFRERDNGEMLEFDQLFRGQGRKVGGMS